MPRGVNACPSGTRWEPGRELLEANCDRYPREHHTRGGPPVNRADGHRPTLPGGLPAAGEGGPERMVLGLPAGRRAPEVAPRMNRRADTPWHRWWNPLSVPSGAVPEPPRPLAPARASKEETNAVEVGNDIEALTWRRFGRWPSGRQAYGSGRLPRWPSEPGQSPVPGRRGRPGPSAPSGRDLHAVGKKGGTIFVIGGYAGGAALGVNEAYKVSKDTWSTWAPMITPGARRWAWSLHGRKDLHRLGGANRQFGASTDQNEVFKPSPARVGGFIPRHPQSEGDPVDLRPE